MTPQSVSLPPGETLLRRTGFIWFIAAAAGQGAFVLYILAFYGRRTVSGNFAGWNDKPVIKGYVAGDAAGNVMFALHVLLATIVTVGGLLQLVPAIRRRAPALHRWNGRLFFSIACFMAFGGLWLTWVRHTYLSVISGIATSLDALLILLFVMIAWRRAIVRDFATHRRWAMRAFIAASGVWFLRVGIMGWILLTGGIGMNKHMSGPADIVLQFGSYLIPLALLEMHFRAQSSHEIVTKRLAGGLILLATGFMTVGIAGAVLFMWWPHIK